MSQGGARGPGGVRTPVRVIVIVTPPHHLSPLTTTTTCLVFSVQPGKTRDDAGKELVSLMFLSGLLLLLLNSIEH